MSELWDTVGSEAEADRVRLLTEAALMETTAHHSVLASAETSADFENRLSLVDAQLDATIASVVEDDIELANAVKVALLNRFRQDFTKNAALVQSEKARTAKRRALLRQEAVADLKKQAIDLNRQISQSEYEDYMANREKTTGYSNPKTVDDYIKMIQEEVLVVDHTVSIPSAWHGYNIIDVKNVPGGAHYDEGLRVVSDTPQAPGGMFPPSNDTIPGEIVAHVDKNGNVTKFAKKASRKIAYNGPEGPTSEWNAGDWADYEAEFYDAEPDDFEEDGWDDDEEGVAADAAYLRNFYAGSRKLAWESANTNKQRRGHSFHMPQDLQRKIPGLYETEGTKTADKMVWAHYFTSSGDWYVTEMDPETGECFGWADLGYGEWGYFDLDEMESVYNPPFGIIERDMNWTPKKVSQIPSIKTYASRKSASRTPLNSPMGMVVDSNKIVPGVMSFCATKTDGVFVTKTAAKSLSRGQRRQAHATRDGFWFDDRSGWAIVSKVWPLATEKAIGKSASRTIR